MAKKVIAIVSLVLIGLLIGATIVMANVKVDYGVNCNNPDLVRILKPGESSPVGPENDEQLNKIKSLIKNASRQSSLNALFNGSLFDEAKVVTDKSTPSSISKKSDCYYVQYVYSNAQTLKEGNDNYKENGNTYLYKELWFEVSNTNGTSEVKVYIIPYLDANGNENQEYVSAKHYALTADFTGLYNYLVENF